LAGRKAKDLVVRWLLRVIGVLFRALSTVGFVGCVAGIVGIWMFRQGVSRHVEDLAARLDAGLQRAAAATQGFRQSQETVRSDIVLVRKQLVDLEAGGEINRFVTGYLRALVRRLNTYSDAAVTVSSLRQSLPALPLGLAGRSNPDQPDQAAERASQVAAAVQNLQELLGPEDRELTKEELVAAANEVERILQKSEETINDWQAELDAARAELPDVEARVREWLTLAAVTVTVACAWVGVSQLSLFAHAWKWCWGA
jgi:hypothetical protein